MPAPLVKRINLDLLYPDYLERLLDLLAACQAKGAHYYATLGHRTFAEQDALYAQGRTKPGAKVTNARGGESLHCYGLAVDVVRDADLTSVGLQPSWDVKGYELLYREAPNFGLETGYAWKFADAGHIQLPRPNGFKTDGQWCAELKKHGALKSVWAHLDSQKP